MDTQELASAMRAGATLVFDSEVLSGERMFMLERDGQREIIDQGVANKMLRAGEILNHDPCPCGAAVFVLAA